MVYVLGHRPDEFGLVPDRDGFVTYKELLWAVHEEPGCGYVRQGDINEVLLGRDRALFEPEDNRIRLLDRKWYFEFTNPTQALQKLLYIAIRRKAYPHVMEKGLAAPHEKYLALSPDREMAMRMGRRRDQKPVLAEITAPSAQGEGILFYAFGDLFLCKEIPARFISGPPVSKEVTKPPEDRVEKEPKRISDFEAGTFVLDTNRDPHRVDKGKKRKGWKEEARRVRRKKWR
jgi:putative RNA 2'-phosphotransferase